MELLSAPILIVLLVIIWVFRRSLKTVGKMAEDALEVSALEVHGGNIERVASIDISDEVVLRAKENKARLSSVII